MSRRTKCGLNSKLHPAYDGEGRPVALCGTERQMNNYKEQSNSTQRFCSGLA